MFTTSQQGIGWTLIKKVSKIKNKKLHLYNHVLKGLKLYSKLQNYGIKSTIQIQIKIQKYTLKSNPKMFLVGLFGNFVERFHVSDFIFYICKLYKKKFDFKAYLFEITIYNTVILVRSVIKLLDRNLVFIEKVQTFYI